MAALLAVALALAVGALITRSPLAAVGLVSVVGLAVGVVRLGLLVPAQLLVASLPWMVILDGLIPPLLRTFTTAVAAIAVLVLVMPLRFRTPTIVIGVTLFFAPVIAHVFFATDGEQFIQASKYTVLPIVALAVTSRRCREVLPAFRNVVLGSALAAMAAHLAIIGAGLGSTGTYYGIGEELGFAPAIPHELSLTAAVVAAAGLVSARRVSVQVAFFALGALPAILSGVRAGLLAVVVVLLIFLLSSRLSARKIAIVVAAVALVFATGAVDAITARFDQEGSEFASVESAGSGRGGLYRVALEGWADAGPGAWVFGAGLRSVPEFELQELGASFVAHTDILEVGVQLGLLALLGWGLIWGAVLAAGLRNLVLAPVLVFSIVNGALEYVAPLVVALVLAAACQDPKPNGEPAS
jgi:O-Antigen ligase